ncbi:MAG: hypothetical protein V1659_04155 [Candidatus Woesearchaeota archaeon]
MRLLTGCLIIFDLTFPYLILTQRRIRLIINATRLHMINGNAAIDNPYIAHRKQLSEYRIVIIKDKSLTSFVFIDIINCGSIRIVPTAAAR